jgi:hypothetical protein
MFTAGAITIASYRFAAYIVAGNKKGKCGKTKQDPHKNSFWLGRASLSSGYKLSIRFNKKAGQKARLFLIRI